MNKISSIIIDDEINVRQRLEDLLDKFEHIELLASEGNPQKGIDLVLEHKPDLVFIDVEMPRMNGFEVVKAIRNKNYYPTFVFVTAYNQYAIKALKNEAFDYLLKPVDIDELAQTIERYTKPRKANNGNKQWEHLTYREIEILEMLQEGLTSKEIADRLHISKTTVDTHRRNILEKTGAKSTTELLKK